jgi:hypothetical protein
MSDPCGVSGEGPCGQNQKPCAMNQKLLHQAIGLKREGEKAAEAISKELE